MSTSKHGTRVSSGSQTQTTEQQSKGFQETSGSLCSILARNRKSAIVAPVTTDATTHYTIDIYTAAGTIRATVDFSMNRIRFSMTVLGRVVQTTETMDTKGAEEFIMLYPPVSQHENPEMAEWLSNVLD